MSNDQNPVQEHPSPTHVVGIGASAGGLEALERLFRAMPADTGMAFVVIQHLSPDFKSLMDELLARFTSMPAIPVSDTIKVSANTIYLLPPRKDLTIEDNLLISRDREKDGTLSLPINLFFRSLAASWGERAMAVVLSGTGSDGSGGILDIRDAGGMVLVETPDSARFDGMPQSAIKTGTVDAILSPENMPKAILAFANDPAARNQFPLGEDDGEAQVGLPSILKLLNRQYKIDFSDYKPATIMRRIGRRVAAMEQGGDDIEQYSERLAKDPEELNTLYKDLLIGVTRFFRDPEAFKILRESVVPQIIDQAKDGEEIRIWVCGCSTGEEAYSIAILFLDAFAKLNREPRIKILATDLHEASLVVAAEGVYDEDKFDDMPRELLDRYFESLDEHHYKVVSSLRRCLIFSVQNVLKDPPFTRMHMVTCRNLLIYLLPPAQARSIAALYYAIRVDGVLFLGPSETLGELSEEVETISRHFKIYRKIKAGTTLLHLRPLPALPDPHTRSAPVISAQMPRIYDRLLERYVPGGILINEHREVQYIFGDASRFIHPGKGRFSGDVLALVSHPISLALTTALRSATKHHSQVVLKGIRDTETEANPEHLRITVDPFTDHVTNDLFFMIHIEPEVVRALPQIELDTSVINSEATSHVRELEVELEKMRESLQTTVEELETTNEELQASNEELLASNEELQSTNEELHSVNEELYSVNAEHELKIEELNRITSDLRNLMQSTDTATIFIDSDTKLRLYTPRALEIFNLMPQDIGRQLQHFQPLVPDPTLFEDVAQVLHDQGPIECPIVCEGERSFIRRCMVYQDVGGQQKGVVINYVDTTQVTRATRSLHDAQARFKGFMDHSPAIAWIKDTRDQIVYFNRAYEDHFGVRLAERLGKSDADLWGTENVQQLHSINRAMLEDNTPREIELTLKRPGAPVSEWRVAKFIIQDAQGGQYVAGIGVDITETKRHLAEIESQRRELQSALETEQRLRTERGQVEKALRASETRFRRVTEMLPQLIWTCTPSGACDYLNPQWMSYTGKSEEQQLGYAWLERIHPDDRTRTMQEWKHTLDQGGNLDTEFRICRHDGVYRWFRTQAVPLRDEEGKIIKWFGSNTDIEDMRQAQTDLKRLNHHLEQRVAERTAELESEKQLLQEREAELYDAKQFAESANQAKSRFLATMSHEIRTPLNVITGMGYMLAQSQLNTEQQQLVTTIEAATHSLLAQINDILDLAKIEAGELTLEREPFELQGVIERCQRLFASSMHDKGLEFMLSDLTRLDLPALLGDAYKIEQILTNLLGNALKFTEQGSVGLDIDVLTREEERITLRLSVSDTGKGIAPSVVARLFQPFSQGDASTTRVHGGTGLGLSLVRQLAECMGGSVGVESTPGTGSRFWCQLPLEIAREEVLYTSCLRVLLAAPPCSARELWQRLCEELGWHVETAENAEALRVRLVQQHEQRLAIDCLLIDAHLPGQALIELLGELHQALGSAMAPVVIVVGVEAQKALARSLADANIQADSLLKPPVEPMQLFNAVNQAAMARSRHRQIISATQIRTAHSYWLADVRVLVVDDSTLNRDVCQHLLTHEGARPSLCESGAAAIELLASDPEAFDIVLMDVQMPGMDGYETTRRLRILLGERELPIIALTAGALESERAAALAADMDDFLTKPIDPVQLIRVLRYHIERTRNQVLLLKPRSVQPKRSANSQEQWPEIPGLELEETRARFADDATLFIELLESFLDETPAQLEAARQFLDKDACKSAVAPLHRARGQAANFGAAQLAGQLANLEHQAAEETLDARGLDEAGRLLQRLSTDFVAWRHGQVHDDTGRTPPDSAPALDLKALEQLRDELAQQKMAALTSFQALTPALQTRLAEPDFARLQRSINTLDFRAALVVLGKL